MRFCEAFSEDLWEICDMMTGCLGMAPVTKTYITYKNYSGPAYLLGNCTCNTCELPLSEPITIRAFSCVWAYTATAVTGLPAAKPMLDFKCHDCTTAQCDLSVHMLFLLQVDGPEHWGCLPVLCSKISWPLLVKMYKVPVPSAITSNWLLWTLSGWKARMLSAVTVLSALTTDSMEKESVQLVVR